MTCTLCSKKHPLLFSGITLEKVNNLDENVRQLLNAYSNKIKIICIIRKRSLLVAM